MLLQETVNVIGCEVQVSQALLEGGGKVDFTPVGLQVIDGENRGSLAWCLLYATHPLDAW